MKYKAVSTLVLLATLLPLSLAASVRAQEQAPKPRYNVLFLMADDLRPELGSYGAPVKTPNLDALAKSGVRFERAYCQYPLCNPSRSSLLTGRYPQQTGVLDNQGDLRQLHPDWVTLPQHFKNNGYSTLATGKIYHGGLEADLSWTEGGQRKKATQEALYALADPDDALPTSIAQQPRPTPQQQRDRKANSDKIIVLPGKGDTHADNKIAEQTMDYLTRYKDKRFFLACGFQKPHSPPTAPQSFFDLYEVSKMELPTNFAPRPTVAPGFPTPSLVPNYDLFIERDATPEQAKEMLRAYRASTSWVDWNVGRVLGKLDELGLREKTIIVLWGDHGYHLGEWGKWSKHGSLYEVGARVPLLVVMPGAKGNGKSSPRIVETLDLYKTLCELGGIPVPAGVEGASLVPLLKDPTMRWDRPAFTVAGQGKNVHIAVRWDRWRYAEYANGQAMLIDEVADPKETKNLADDPMHATMREKLAGMLRAYRAKVK
ncbi:sulfatase [Armatimonas sp.]|uniref:sulfatase n=1 Tax=Armatimonas sp. TaxID=1872638 RepID=UPI00286B4F7B|nr:sulfatase [Armatimonas sp.]